MDLAQRIAQFENMAQADPSNEMAHFSLAGAYAQAGRHADAAESYIRCIRINPEMSKAYQMAADALIKAGARDRALELLNKGYEVAARKGDLMPRNAMAALFAQLGVKPPEVRGAAPEPAAVASGDVFICARTGRRGTRLPRPPFKGPVGQWIFEHITAETWREWIGQGTKVINELRLDLSRDQDNETYDRYMREYLGIDEALYEQLTAQHARR